MVSKVQPRQSRKQGPSALAIAIATHGHVEKTPSRTLHRETFTTGLATRSRTNGSSTMDANNARFASTSSHVDACYWRASPKLPLLNRALYILFRFLCTACTEYVLPRLCLLAVSVDLSPPQPISPAHSHLLYMITVLRTSTSCTLSDWP